MSHYVINGIKIPEKLWNDYDQGDTRKKVQARLQLKTHGLRFPLHLKEPPRWVEDSSDSHHRRPK